MTTDIHHLLDKYFEGDTSSEEEKVLRHYFMQDDILEELKVYAPIFRFLDDEATALTVLNEIRQERTVPVRKRPIFLRRLQTIAAVAAVFLIGLLLVTRPDKQSLSSSTNYVWVDGRKITDPATVRKYAESSFGKVQPESDIIEEQLRFMLE